MSVLPASAFLTHVTGGESRSYQGVGDLSQCIDEFHALRHVHPVPKKSIVPPLTHGGIAFNDRRLPPFFGSGRMWGIRQGTLGAGAAGTGGEGAHAQGRAIRLASVLAPVKEPRAVAVMTVTSARESTVMDLE